MSSVPSDPHLASFPRPQGDNGRGIHFILDPRNQDVMNNAPQLTRMKFTWCTVYGGDENVVCSAAQFITQSTGAMCLLRADLRPPHSGGGGYKTPDFWGKMTTLAISMGLVPYIQIGNEWTTEGWKASQIGPYWTAAAQGVVDAGGYPGFQCTGEEEAATIAGMSDAVSQKMWFAHHGQPANHPPAYPYDARNQQDHPGATAITDNSCMLSALQVPYWSQKYWGGVTVPVITTEGPWTMQAPGDTGQDARYPAVTQDLWYNYVYAAYQMFRNGIMPNGDPLPDWWFAFNYWLLYDGGGFMAAGLLGSWHPEWKARLVNQLTVDEPYVRTFSGGGGTVPPPPPPPPPISTQAKGIDVSTYQGAIDWAQVKNSGISFAFIKATEGTSLVDDRFSQNWAGAKAAGVRRSAYHYYHNDMDPVQQANNLKAAVGNDWGERQPVVDVEDETAKGDANKLLVFCRNLPAMPLIYTRKSYWDEPKFWNGPFTWSGGNDLWVADYTGNTAPLLPSDWTTWKFWQTGQGTVPGVNGKVDLDVFNGSVGDLLSYDQAHAVPPPAPVGPYVDPRVTWANITQGAQYQVAGLYYYNNTPPDDPESEGNINIYTVVRDANGKGLEHEAVKQMWPTGSSTHYTRNGQTLHQQSGDSSFDPKTGAKGPYIMQIGDCAVAGLGLVLRQHVEYLIEVVKNG